MSRIPIDLGRVEGSKDLYLALRIYKHFNDLVDIYIYITPEGRVWRQYCDHRDNSKCDDGVDITIKELYQTLLDYLEQE